MPVAAMAMMATMPMAVVAIVVMPVMMVPVMVMPAAPFMPPIPAPAVPVTIAVPAVIARCVHHGRRRRHIDRRRRGIDRGADVHAHIHMRHCRTRRQQGHDASEQRCKKNRMSHDAVSS
ncbi:hypothetical protein A2G96_02505 [Cupriavidus nantongensis]|uniref:Uncharacterized protein n=1 Tax=Cupriavidus nantongensis TaxID=1796606 RepID=A0A142JF41_9BURK|nr:hypothetical protein A2G96_02505 [Cupriavidus nantongensis]